MYTEFFIQISLTVLSRHGSCGGSQWGSNWELSSSTNTPPSGTGGVDSSPSLSPHHATLSPRPSISSSSLDSPRLLKKNVGGAELFQGSQGGDLSSPKRRSPADGRDDGFGGKKRCMRSLKLASDEGDHTSRVQMIIVHDKFVESWQFCPVLSDQK